MTRPTKKDAEKAVAKGFLSAAGLAAVSVLMRDSPDVLVTTSDGRRIALELTEHLQGKTGRRGNALVQFESAWEKLWPILIDKQDQHGENVRLSHVSSTLILKDRLLPRESELEYLAQELVEAKAQALCAVENQGTFTLQEFTQGDLADLLVKKVHFRHVPYAAATDWYCGNAHVGWIGLSSEHVVRLLREKGNLVGDYRKELPECPQWLVIYCQPSLYVSSVSPPEELLKSMGRDLCAQVSGAGFDEIWFYDGWAKKATQLYTATNQSGASEVIQESEL